MFHIDYSTFARRVLLYHGEELENFSGEVYAKVWAVLKYPFTYIYQKSLLI